MQTDDNTCRASKKNVPNLNGEMFSAWVVNCVDAIRVGDSFLHRFASPMGWLLMLRMHALTSHVFFCSQIGFSIGYAFVWTTVVRYTLLHLCATIVTQSPDMTLHC